ncbi:hypothetical protein [Micromonospora sp. NBC_00421]|uniref:hypothetical protein n=1 Tax=Micromonospora sp. NBC_00421 TaxID=2975976 RepID=UPI002E23AD90
MPSGSDPPPRLAFSASSDADFRRNQLTGFRAVRELLLALEPARDFAGLRRVVSESGDYLWV